MKQNKPQKKTVPEKRVQKKAPAKKKGLSVLPFFIFSALIGITFIAFFPALNNEFTNWDDPTYIINNPVIKDLSGENISRIFTEIYFSNYQPLHLLSYMIEYNFFGLNPSGYHWVSLLMHCINILLVWRIAKFLSKNDYIAFFTALLFAVTPMRVESVAWAAERKDLLYAMFFFAAFLCYLFYHQSKFGKRYLVLTFIFFILSVFSKAMAVSLVPVLFLVDFYYNRKFTVKVILEKLPFIIISVIMGIVSVTASQETGSIDTSSQFTLIDRIFFACQNLLMYASKLVVPFGLTGFYRYPSLVNGSIPVNYYVSGVLILLIAALVILSLRKGKLIFFSTGFFVSTLALVLMILPVGPTVFSERYSYVPSVLFYFTLLYYLFRWIEKYNSKQWMMAASVALIAYSLFFVQKTRARCEVWKDSMSFWSDIIQSDPKNPEAYNNRGNVFITRGQSREAIEDLLQAIKFKPGFPSPYAGLADAYRAIGKNDSALYFAHIALAIDPKMVQALNNRAIVYIAMNQPDSAMKDFNESIRLKPEMFEAYGNRANLNYAMGNNNLALQDYLTALRINPDFSDAYKNLGVLYKAQNRIDDAIHNLKMYLQTGGKDARVYMMIGQYYTEKNDFASAADMARQAMKLGVPDAEKFFNRWNGMVK